MAEAAYYAPSVLEIDEAGIVTGGWLDQVMANGDAHFREALALHRRAHTTSTAFTDLARWAINGGSDECYTAIAAKAILLHPDFEMHDVSLPGLRAFDYQTKFIPGKVGEAHMLMGLLHGTVERRTFEKRGLLRRQVPVAEIVPRYAVAGVLLDNKGKRSFMWDTERCAPLDFARRLEILVHAARPHYQDGVVTIGNHEIMRTREAAR